MSSRHLVDPDFLPMLAFPAASLSTATYLEARATMAEMSNAFTQPTPEGVEVTHQMIPGPAGAPELRMTIAKPAGADGGRPGILHIHGGGYVMRSLGTESTIAGYAAAIGAVAIGVEYRLAPEHPHPALVEDNYAALQWLHDHAGSLGVDLNRIAVTGESAGGGLAAAVCLLARDRGQIKIAFQHLVFPMLDDRTNSRTDLSPNFGEFLWPLANNLFGWASLLGANHKPGDPDISPYAAPARAADLAGLPTTFIACGALDLFLEEDMEYARRLMVGGAPTELHIYPGAPHGFNFVQAAAVSQAFQKDSIAAFRRALHFS